MATKTASQQDSSSTAVDVIVVGGGVIGLACAWRCAERGLRVKVIERDRPGAGASNVAAGMLAPVGEASWGEDRLLELALASHRLWPEFAAELAAASDADVGYLRLGALHVALDRDEAAELRAALRADAVARARGRVADARANVASSSPGSRGRRRRGPRRRTRRRSTRGR